MSAFSGPMGKGAMRDLRMAKRAEAEKRNARTPDSKRAEARRKQVAAAKSKEERRRKRK